MNRETYLMSPRETADILAFESKRSLQDQSRIRNGELALLAMAGIFIVAGGLIAIILALALVGQPVR